MDVFRKELEDKTSRERFLGWQYLLAEAVMITGGKKNKTLKQGRYSLAENEGPASQKRFLLSWGGRGDISKHQRKHFLCE